MLLRAWLQMARIPPRNPLTMFVVAVTDWLVRPLRSAIPSAGGIDLASLLAAYLCATVLVTALLLLHGAGLAALKPTILGIAMFWLVKWALYLVMWITLLQAVISWINPHAPIAPALGAINDHASSRPMPGKATSNEKVSTHCQHPLIGYSLCWMRLH